jgi:site-specific recombinase XerD
MSPEAFHAYLLAQGRSENTATSYASDVRGFLKWAGDDWPSDEFGRSCEAYINDERDGGVSNASILRHMSSLRHYYKFLVQIDPTVTQPFTNYKGPKVHKATAHPLPGMMDDVHAMIKAAWRPQHKILIALCGLAGCRISEARSITPRSLMKDHQGFWWLTIIGKGGAYREVPVMDELFDLLDDHQPEGPDTPYVKVMDRAARKAITAIGERAGISRPVSSHDLRHTFGSWVYGQTKDLRMTQELLGHADAKTTQGYTYVEQEAKRAAVMGVLA